MSLGHRSAPARKAARLPGAAAAWRVEKGQLLTYITRADRDHAVRVIRAVIGEDARAVERGKGHAMTLEEAIDEVV